MSTTFKYLMKEVRKIEAEKIEIDGKQIAKQLKFPDEKPSSPFLDK